MSMPIVIIGLSLISYFILNSRKYYNSNGYREMNFGGKVLLVLFYICYLGVTITSFGSSGSDAHAVMIYPLIGSIVFGMSFILLFKADGMTLKYKIITSAVILFASLIRYSMYVLAALLPIIAGNKKQTYKSRPMADNDFDSAAAEQRTRYFEAQAEEEKRQAEINARAHGFNTVEEAEEFGVNR